uniref:DUF4190 domain-containing protein n=1 Tax=viral metagenome TaxID=1070528 RepID=A0A6C0HWT8_9ZZZZ
MTSYSNNVNTNSLENYNDGNNMYRNSAVGMIITGIFPVVGVSFYYYTKKNLKDTLMYTSIYGIILGLVFSIIQGILWAVSKKNADAHPEKKTDGPVVYRNVFFANIAMLIISIIILFILIVTDKKNTQTSSEL